MWFMVDISVKNKHQIAYFNVSVEYGRIVSLCATSMVLTDSFSSLLIQTAKDETAYTQVSDKPDEPSQTTTNQPMKNGSYIAMSPVEAQKC